METPSSIDNKIENLQNEIKLLKQTKQEILNDEYDKKNIPKNFLLVDNRIECNVDSKNVFSFSLPNNFSNHEFVNNVMNLNCIPRYDNNIMSTTIDVEYIGKNNFTYIKKLRDNAYIFRTGSNDNYLEIYLTKKEMENLTQLILKTT